MQWIVRCLLRYKGWVLLAVILMAAEMTANLSAIWLQQSIIDEVLINGQRDRFPLILTQLACAYLAYSLLFTFGPHIIHHTVARLRKVMSAELMQSVRRLPVKEIHNKRTADLVYRFTHDLGQVSGLIGGDIPRLAQHLAGAIMLIVIIGGASPALLAVVGSFGMVYILLGKRFARPRKHAAGQVNKDKANLLVHLEEGVAATREVLAFRREQWEARQYQSLFRTYYNSVMKEAKLINRQMLISDPIKWGAVIIVLLFGGWQVLNEQLSIGLYVVLFQFSSRLIDSLYYVYNNLMSVSGKLASVERIRMILESETIREGQTALSDPVNQLQLDGVSFKYEGREHSVLNRITLEVPIGSKTAFVGTSGGGKSTIASLLMRFYEPDEGRILVNGLPLSSISRGDWTKKAAIVFQEPYLFPESIRTNLLLGIDGVTEEKMIEICKAMRIHDFIEGLAERYDTVVGERGITLSGGQRQRIAIARALLYDPEVLILDEATSSLDMETEREIQTELDRLRKGRTTIVIAHRLSTVRNAERIYVLDQGTVAEQGTHDELMTANTVYRRLVLKQRTEEDGNEECTQPEVGLRVW
ncbi:ABC transporter ATP-binding protein [Paenibacillus senegalensis]|uniref:ABC transporter ATP-binding protein n=1 Tax=Paenibacillus senegalensis TaxID=1465766 RepID=UPI001F47D2EB|nr:ABC transporter ATP-binding protein [Paenibacillus senegalensis]